MSKIRLLTIILILALAACNSASPPSGNTGWDSGVWDQATWQ